MSATPLKVEDARAYLEHVKTTFASEPQVYNQFLDIMQAFKNKTIGTPGIIKNITQLFHRHTGLIMQFNTFLPTSYKIKESDLSDENHPAYVAPMTVQHDSTSPVELEAAPMGVVYPAARWPGALAPAATAPVQQQRKAAIDFKKNQAIKFVNKIKTHFAKDSDVYKQFLEIMQMYSKDKGTIKQVYGQVERLFKDQPDLMDEFTDFLPDARAVQERARAEAEAAARVKISKHLEPFVRRRLYRYPDGLRLPEVRGHFEGLAGTQRPAADEVAEALVADVVAELVVEFETVAAEAAAETQLTLAEERSRLWSEHAAIASALEAERVALGGDRRRLAASDLEASGFETNEQGPGTLFCRWHCGKMDWVAAEGPHAGMTRAEDGLVAAELPVVWGCAEPEPESEPALHVASDGLQQAATAAEQPRVGAEPQRLQHGAMARHTPAKDHCEEGLVAWQGVSDQVKRQLLGSELEAYVGGRAPSCAPVPPPGVWVSRHGRPGWADQLDGGVAAAAC